MRRGFFYIILLLVTAFTLPGQDAGPDIGLVKARYLISVKDYTGALDQLQNISPSSADQPQFIESMGIALLETGKTEEADQWFNRLARLNPARAWYCLARLSVRNNDLSRGLDYLARHLADPSHLPEQTIKMEADFVLLEENREWIRLWQKDWYSSVELALREAEYLLKSGDQEDAAAKIDAILNQDPRSADGWFIKARLETMQGETRQASQSIDRAIQLAASQPPILEKILQYCLVESDYDRVNSLAGRLLRLDPTNPDYLVSRALARVIGGTESTAVRELETIREAGIPASELWFQAGKKLMDSSPRQADEFLTRAIETGVMDARFYYSRGTARLILGKYDLALEDMAMSLDINPLQPDLYYDRAEIRLLLGDTDGACHDWNKAKQQGNTKAPDRLYKYCR